MDRAAAVKKRKPIHKPMYKTEEGRRKPRGNVMECSK